MNKQKFLKLFLFVFSAILVAFILSIIFNKFSEKHITDGSTEINNQKDLLIIGDKTIEEIIKPSTTDSLENNQENDSKTTSDKNTESFIFEESSNNEDKNLVIDTPKTENNAKTEIFTENYIIPEEAVEQLEKTGIAEKDVYFLRDIVIISDSIISNYNETLSYALSAEFEKGNKSLEYLEKDIESLNNLETNDKELKKVKDYLKKGTQNYIDGFKDYFNYGDNSESLFKSADTNFYNAQTILQEYLNTFKK